MSGAPYRRYPQPDGSVIHAASPEEAARFSRAQAARLPEPTPEDREPSVFETFPLLGFEVHHLDGNFYRCLDLMTGAGGPLRNFASLAILDGLHLHPARA